MLLFFFYMSVLQKLKLVNFFGYVKNLRSCALKYLVFPLEKYTLGQSGSSTTIAQAAVAKKQLFHKHSN